jgi:sulfur carrier protein
LYPSNDPIRIELNGRPQALPAGTTVDALLARLGVRAEAAAVEVDEQLVPRAERASRVLADGARVEVVTLVGGG